MTHTTLKNWALGGALAALLALATAFDLPVLDDLEERQRTADRVATMQAQIDARMALLVQRTREHDALMQQLLQDAQQLCEAQNGYAAARITTEGDVFCLSKERTASSKKEPQI
jgi:hypothetical protein